MMKQISSDIVKAMKGKEKERLTVLRSLKSALKNKEIDIKKELDDDGCIAVLHSQVKMRKQAIELYVQGGREELAEQERKEIEIIKSYLPQPLSESELTAETEAIIAELGADSMKDMGAVMKALKEKLKSRADGKLLSSIVRSKLS
jgi:uncharacterized protein